MAYRCPVCTAVVLQVAAPAVKFWISRTPPSSSTAIQSAVDGKEIAVSASFVRATLRQCPPVGSVDERTRPELSTATHVSMLGQDTPVSIPLVDARGDPSAGGRSFRTAAHGFAEGAECLAHQRFVHVVGGHRPTGGQASWSRVLVDHAAGVSSISCPTISLCVAVDEHGNVLTSTTPSGTTPWSSAHVDAAADNEEGGLYAVSWPSTTFCAAVDDLGNVLRSRSPTGGVAAWQTIPIRRPDPLGLSPGQA
jgi:hypothetical protein